MAMRNTIQESAFAVFLIGIAFISGAFLGYTYEESQRKPQVECTTADYTMRQLSNPQGPVVHKFCEYGQRFLIVSSRGNVTVVPINEEN